MIEYSLFNSGLAGLGVAGCAVRGADSSILDFGFRPAVVPRDSGAVNILDLKGIEQLIDGRKQMTDIVFRVD